MNKSSLLLWSVFTLVFTGIFLVTISFDLRHTGKLFKGSITGMVVTDPLDLRIGDIFFDTVNDEYYVVIRTNILAKYDYVADTWVERDIYFSDGFANRKSSDNRFPLRKIEEIHETMPGVIKDTFKGNHFWYITRTGNEILLEKPLKV